jgi:DNA replication and repair protein RecF
MELSWLEVSGFRSYESLSLRPATGVNVLIGDNGSGKTSVLEAIGYLATLKSFRRAPDAALVADGADSAIVRGEFTSAGGKALVEIENPAAGRRQVRLNGKRAQSRAEVASLIALVAFLPDDLDLVKRGPAYRREYLDDLAVQLWPSAAADQQEYERAVRQRNALLRREGRHSDPTTLDVLDERIAVLGSAVLHRRLRATAQVAPVLAGLFGVLGDSLAELGWRYEAAGLDVVEGTPERDALEEGLHKAVAAAREGDMERRVTTVGPHRDEIVFLIDDRDARTRASQGEQRSIALGLRIAAYEVISEQRALVPILLLDDVFSELDPGRSQRLVERLPDGQVFVTSAREEEVPLVGQRWSVSGGNVVAA